MSNINDFFINIAFILEHHPFLSFLSFVIFISLALCINNYSYNSGKEEGLDTGYYMFRNWMMQLFEEYGSKEDKK